MTHEIPTVIHPSTPAVHKNGFRSQCVTLKMVIFEAQICPSKVLFSESTSMMKLVRGKICAEGYPLGMNIGGGDHSGLVVCQTFPGLLGQK